ncbi:MAG: hypothetical protein AB7K71_27325 [Polyangiaceae bacterium]
MAEREILRPSVALAAYVESLLEGRRAIVFGDSSSDIAERLLERGARLVHVYDPDSSRVAEAATRNTSRSVSYAPLGEGGLAVRDGAFDVAIVEDLSAEADPAGLLRKVKRCLGPRGAALIATRNPDVRISLLPSTAQPRLSYYELYDAVSGEFEEVRMLGQTPFVAYAVVDFAPEGEPAVSLDNGFVPGGAEEPEYFVALAAQRELKLEEFAVIQLSARDALAQRGGSVSSRQHEAVVARERSARGRLEKLEAELEKLQAQLSEAGASRGEQSAKLEAAKAQAAQAAKEAASKDEAARARRIAELEREVDKRGRWISELEARAAAADARADSIQGEFDKASRKWSGLAAELDAARRELEVMSESGARQQQQDRDTGRLEGRLKELEAERRRAEERAERAERERTQTQDKLKQVEEQRESARDRAGKLQAELRHAETNLKQAESKLSEVAVSGSRENADELNRLEHALRERGGEIRRLQAELLTAERVGKQLVAELMELRERAHDQALQIPAPASVNANAEAPVARAAEPRVPLEEAQVAKVAEQNALLQADLEAARWSIEELEARLASLSAGESAVQLSRQLASARAELQRKAALIAQLQANVGASVSESSGPR